MKITLDWLKKEAACSEGVKWFGIHKFKTDKEVFEKLISDDKFNWANWTIVRLMDHVQKIQYAIFAAEKVIDIFEKKYPKDERPRKAIEAAKNYLKNPSENAAGAASAAESAAWSAESAARNAASAAWNAASAAANAASAAWNAASAAANAASAARNAAIKEIIEFGIKFLD